MAGLEQAEALGLAEPGYIRMARDLRLVWAECCYDEKLAASQTQDTGEGDAGPKGGPQGDLYVFLSVTPDPRFRRKGMDIFSEVTVSYLDETVMLDHAIQRRWDLWETKQFWRHVEPQ